MIIKFLSAAAFAFTVLLVTSTSAFASCVLGDTAGNWQMYVSNANGGWASCPFVISASGNVAGASCLAGDGTNKPLSGGKLQLFLGAKCAFKGSFKYNGLSFTIKHMTISSDHNISAGVGTTSGVGAFHFTMIKQ